MKTMRKILILLVLLSFIGCAANQQVAYDYSQDDRYPPGKTDVDWEREEMECRTMSGKMTGIIGLTWIGFINNSGKVNDEYDACMRKKGWLK